MSCQPPNAVAIIEPCRNLITSTSLTAIFCKHYGGQLHLYLIGLRVKVDVISFSVAFANQMVTIASNYLYRLLWTDPMRSIVFILLILIPLTWVLIVNPRIYPDSATVADHPRVGPTPPPSDQGSGSAPPPSASAAPVKVVAVARSVRGIPRRSGDMSPDPYDEQTVASVVSNPYRPHWMIEWYQTDWNHGSRRTGLRGLGGPAASGLLALSVSL